MRSIRWVGAAGIAAMAVAACGGSDDGAEPGSAAEPTVVVTTNILGDVVSSLVGDAAEVTTIMPPGASPHDFQASAQQAQAMREADLLVVNGAGFEEGLVDVIQAAEGDDVPVYEAISAVETLAFGDDHAEEGDEHAEAGDADEHSGEDPHFFTDPARMALAAQGILDELTEQVPALDTDAVRAEAEAYIGELEALDADVERTLDAVAEADRILVTNHEVFGYFADRYGFEVVGTVIPGGTTSEGTSAADLAELVEVVEEEGVPAVFADTSSPDRLAQALASEVGDVEVVELYSESLGEPGSGAETYLEMVRVNAERIASALS